MIPAFIIWIINLFLGFLTWLFSLASFALMPQWLSVGISDVFRGGRLLMPFLPLYATPGLSGLAGQIGIMDIFGYFLLVITSVLILKLMARGIMFAVGLIPWNTQGASDSINPNQ